MKKQGIPAKEDRHMYLIEDFDNKDFTKERRKHKGSFVDTMHAIMA